MSHKLISGIASAAIGLAVLGGGGTAVAATPTTLPAHSNHDNDNVCWNVHFYRADGNWHVRWTDSDGKHHEKARTFAKVLDEFKDECDRVVRNKHHDRDRDHRHDHDHDKDHKHHDDNGKDKDKDKDDRDHRDKDKDDRDHRDRDHHDKDDHDHDHDKDRHYKK